MGPKSTPSSRTSLISIDPAIASHITSSKPLTASQHSRTGSTPAKTHSTQPTTYTRSHGRNNSAPSKNQSKRSTSLRRAKNSTEVLRQRSTKKGQDSKPGDVSSDTKRGRNFTVTNVGTGGFLYLRPSTHQAPMSPAMSPPPPTPLTAPATTVVVPDEGDAYLLATEHNPHGRSFASRTRSVSPKRLLQRVGKAKDGKPIRPSHTRSQSFSTIDESRRSITSSWPKTLKIIINRIDPSESKRADIDLKPSLEIPIPHYRLGVPRFSTHGTPILRNSVYSRTSSVQSIRRSSTVKQDGASSAPPPASLKAFAKLQSFDPSIENSVDQPLPMSETRDVDSAPRTSDSFERPLSPAIYDELTDHYNDPSVVRFAHDVRDVTAATPARIIAQISSESFMDYELVSDFFLTFRSYMTTVQVLDLLLARLAWAIGRMSDDGRIIRIRTFAALRHWILNYFMDDFVINRRLRIRFCEAVNDLYYEVQSKQIGGPSDLKILQDLKRCWNGRCSLYWDGEQFNMDGNQDEEVHPGGVIGSRDPDCTNSEEVRMPLSQAPLSIPQPPPIPVARTAPLPEIGVDQHGRQQTSFASSRAAESLASDQSIQAHSCSILRNPIRTAADAPLNVKRPHPVTVLERRQKAPSELQVQTNRPSSRTQHRRGGSSFDSTRERPLPDPPGNTVLLPEFHDGSIIRGFVYAPVEPFVHVPSKLPLTPSSAFEFQTESPDNGMDAGHYLAMSSPAVKNIFGSIRRALSGKPGTGEMAMITISAPYSNQSLSSKKSPLPINISKSYDELRGKASTMSMRSAIRIDLLCAAAIESYRSTVPEINHLASPLNTAEMLEANNRMPGSQLRVDLVPGKSDSDRVTSHMTAESGSILIVDGTGLGAPTMSGAVQYATNQDDALLSEKRNHSEAYESDKHPSFETQIAFQDETRQEDRGVSHMLSGRVDGQNTQEQLSTASNIYSSTLSTTTVKNHPSLSSSNAQSRAVANAGVMDSEVTLPQEYADGGTNGNPMVPPPTLRRRPGGDLRKNQNVHDMEQAAPHHESLDSVMDTAPTSVEVQPIANVVPVNRVPHPEKPDLQVSMINTHSSQHLRPSFEAAVAGFSAIPDDGDGGLEATLLKLEGRYDRDSPELEQFSPSSASSEVFSGSTIPSEPQRTHEVSDVIYRGYAHDPSGRLDSLSQEEGYHYQTTHPQQVFAHRQLIFGLPTESLAASEDSVNSIPLLQRRSAAAPTSDPSQSPQSLQVEHQVPPLFGGRSLGHRQELPADRRDTGYLNKVRNILRPEMEHTDRTFLLDEDENLSDLSSEMSVDIINYSDAMGSAASAMLVAPGTAVSGLEIPSHPLAHSSFVNLSMHPSLALDSGSGLGNRPLTPEMSPTVRRAVKHNSKQMLKGTAENKRPRTQIPVGPAHIPFILACDSQLLAQQLTLIEQSGLTEIEWSDLVEMRWSNRPANILDWAEYVTKQDVRGVDLVITRFNLMVKWTISEIILTQNMEERVRVITKFIHVAAHARRLHNYATMLQLTIALTSTDCTRLTKTWESVSSPDRSLLKNMETLIQPIRNFHDLRLEMESADLTDGCIPFIGLYVHDLTYNSQKPVEIDAGKHQPPLINFERFRTSAIIVKGLLRLIDASAKYDFIPVHGVIERCLWIAALEDERIRTLSRTLEETSTTT